ncbi:MAG TPA: pyridoxal-phosphate dependent enzyme [Thermoanaerobaculia bacterium]|nr:pyridoxal-phosphate dependent enzyme [Thermoanaerobaculia bacterium]
MSVAPVRHLQAPTLHDVRAARERLDGIVRASPLLRLEWEPPAPAAHAAHASDIAGGKPAEIYLKLENLQPIGSFKLRGATNAMLMAAQAPGAGEAAQAGRDSALAAGVYTASAGNMAQGVAWAARRLGVAATAIVPDHAPATKLAAIERLGGTVVKVPFESWWQVIAEHRYPGMPGLFIHPVSDTAVMAGNGTIGLEIVEQLPDVDLVLVPFGGGGLSCGIAAALRELRPGAAVYGCEVTTAAPLAASLAAGAPQSIDYQPTFVDGIGGKAMLPEMWPIVSRLLAGSRVVPLAAVAAAVRLLAERHRVIAEGAGATSVAAAMALAADVPGKKIVCIVSGGNIDNAKLAAILAGDVP